MYNWFFFMRLHPVSIFVSNLIRSGRIYSSVKLDVLKWERDYVRAESSSGYDTIALRRSTTLQVNSDCRPLFLILLPPFALKREKGMPVISASCCFKSFDVSSSDHCESKFTERLYGSQSVFSIYCSMNRSGHRQFSAGSGFNRVITS